jgi:uncharacterized membrane protein
MPWARGGRVVAGLPSAPPDYPDPAAYQGRRRRVRGLFLAIGTAILLGGVILVGVGFFPRALGLGARPLGDQDAGGFFGLLLVLWGSLILLRVAVRSGFRGPYGRGGYGPGRIDPAIMTARQRYARGEITREQFHQIVGDLRRPPGPPPGGALPP